MKDNLASLLVISGLLFTMTTLNGCIKGEEGPMGPPGTVGLGTIEGKIRLWKDYYQRNTDHSGVVIRLEKTEYRDTTGVDGSYRIENVPAGVYTIAASKEGYGTMKEYNFTVGGGVSYFSPDLARIALAPEDVKATYDTIEVYGETTPAVRLSWSPADTTLTNLYWIYYSEDQAFRESMLVTRVLAQKPSRIYIYGLEQGVYYFGIRADNGVGYIDETSGVPIYPTMSALSRAAEPIVILESSGIKKSIGWVGPS